MTRSLRCIVRSLALAVPLPFALLDAQTLSLSRIRDIGGADTASEHVLGVATDVAVGYRGLLFVLDGRMKDVKVYDRDGKFLRLVGRPGRGPGEFFAPSALTTDSTGALYVLDPGNGRVTVFAVSDSTSRELRSVAIDFLASDFCILGDGLFLLGYREDRIIHHFSLAGRHIDSFGSPYPADHPLLLRTLPAGRLECIPDHRMVVTMPSWLPEVRAYTSAGELAWVTRLPDYQQVVAESGPEGTVTWKRGATGSYHTGISLVPVSSTAILAQVGLVGPQSRMRDYEFAELTTHLLSLADGRIVRSDGSMPIVTMRHEREIYAAENSPYPRVVAYRLAVSAR